MTGFALEWRHDAVPPGTEDVTLYCDGVALGIGRGPDRAAALRDCWAMLIEQGEGNGAVGYAAEAYEQLTGAPPEHPSSTYAMRSAARQLLLGVARG